MNSSLLILALVCTFTGALAQQQAGDVVGTLSGQALKYHGEFEDDMFGPGAAVSLHYAPIDRLAIEARFGLGEVRWKVSPSKLANNPDYFGAGAQLGDLYPGTSTTIEDLCATSVTTADLILRYVLVPGIDAVPFLSAGIGYIGYRPTNATEREPLPNYEASVYSGSAISFPLGGGVQIPFSERVSLLLRGEYRVVLSDYLDDFAKTSANDALTSISIGLTYRFNEPGDEDELEPMEVDIQTLISVVPVDDPHHPVLCELCCEACCDPCCAVCCIDHHGDCCCCCCCCCCGDGAGSGGGGGSGSGDGSGGGGGGGGEVGPPPPPARDAFSKDIRFKLDTDEFDFNFPQTNKNLQELLTYMKEAPAGHEVIIEGHASGEGPPKRNQVLSDIRAKKIREWLIEQGVDPSKIRGTVGYGSSMPRVQEPTPEEMKNMSKEEIESIRAQNRRIDVHILKDAYKTEAEEARKKWEEEKKKAEAQS